MNQVSIIISTYNGKEKVHNALQSLELQTFTNFEVVVMIDGSTDGTYAFLSKQNYNLELNIYQQENLGRSIVRNNGAKKAKGDLLIFFDDDMHLKKECIEVHCNHHNEFTSSILVGAQVDEIRNAKTDIQRYKCDLAEVWLKDLKKLKGVPINKNHLFITAANFSINKKLFFDLGGFDENLNDSEDWDLAVKADIENVNIYYNHDAFAFHNDPITCHSYVIRQKQYLKYHKKLLQLKPEIYSEYNKRVLIKNENLLKTIIYFVLKLKFWIEIIDNFNFLIVIPQKIRYKIYSAIIHSHLK